MPAQVAEQSCREFASANQTAGARDEAVQVSRPRAAFSFGLRNHLGLDNCRYNDYRYHVRKTSKSKPIKNEPERTFVTLLRVTDMLSRRPAQLLKKEDLSMNQYNVLRILRGAPDGLPCGEISNRMITRDPDITRLLDRLEKRGFISRSRESKDRRTVTARLTSEGYALLARLDEPVQDTHRQQLGHLSEKRLRELSDLLTACCDRLA